MIQYHLHCTLATDSVVFDMLIWSKLSANEEKNLFTLLHCLLALSEYMSPTVNDIQIMWPSFFVWTVSGHVLQWGVVYTGLTALPWETSAVSAHTGTHSHAHVFNDNSDDCVVRLVEDCKSMMQCRMIQNDPVFCVTTTRLIHAHSADKSYDSKTPHVCSHTCVT